MTSTADGNSSLALPVLDADLEARLRARMEEVEERLELEITSEATFVTEAARHLMHAGGKRFRPLLVLLAAETGDASRDGVLTSACVVELTHLASLYHDDVMDEADLRRGAESANARWDNHVAILTGDFLFSKSSELTAELGPAAVRIQAQTFTALVEGQILETIEPAPGEDALEHYLDVVAGKTGSLIATSARYGAIFGGAQDPYVLGVGADISFPTGNATGGAAGAGGVAAGGCSRTKIGLLTMNGIGGSPGAPGMRTSTRQLPGAAFPSCVSSRPGASLMTAPLCSSTMVEPLGAAVRACQRIGRSA